MMRFLKRLVALVTFVAGLACLCIGASAVVTPKNNTTSSGIEEESANGILGEADNSIDVLVLGDSESYSAISPMQIWKETGYTSYICGSSGQSLDYTKTLLLRALEKQSPKVVILETDTLYRDVTPANAFISAMGNVFSVFRYHNRWKTLSVSDLTTKPQYTWTSAFKGFDYCTIVDGIQSSDYMQDSGQTATIKETNQSYAKQIQEICAEHGAELILVSTPSPVNWNMARHNGVQELATQLGCRYIDLNQLNSEIGIDWTKDTRDKGDHLNYYGATKVSHYLATYLYKRQILTDHRSDTAYASWNSSLSTYLSETKSA